MTDSIPTDRRRTDRPSDEDARRSPDNVATVVAYLASERSGWLTGRIVHSAGFEVSLYNNMAPVVRLIGQRAVAARRPGRAGRAVVPADPGQAGLSTP